MILVLMGVCGSGKTTVGQALAEKLGWSFVDADEFHCDSNKEKMSQGLPLTDEDRIPWLLSIHDYIIRKISEKQCGVVTCSALKKSYRNLLRFGAINPLGGHSSSTRPDCPPVPMASDTHVSTTTASINMSTDISRETSKDKHAQNKLNQDSSTGSAFGSEINKLNQDSCRGFGPEIMFVHLTGSQAYIQERMEARQGHFFPASLLESQLKTLEDLDGDEPGIEVDIATAVDSIVPNIVDRLKL